MAMFREPGLVLERIGGRTKEESLLATRTTKRGKGTEAEEEGNTMTMDISSPSRPKVFPEIGSF